MARDDWYREDRERRAAERDLAIHERDPAFAPGTRRGMRQDYTGVPVDPAGYREPSRQRPGYGPYAWAGSGSDGLRHEHEGGRGLMEKAADTVSSWFGDDDAARRREMDHRGRGPKGWTRSDERIHDDVCHRLTEDDMVDASDVEVTVSGAEVTLNGTVSDRSQRRRAEDCVEAVSGVRHVQNNLRVRDTGMEAGSRRILS
jgi:osmotically-inducible protein OsmY